MLKLLAVSILLFVLATAELEPRIIKGQFATEGQFPYIASLKTRKDLVHFCTATVLTPCWVLTAAHCFDVECKGCRPEDVVVLTTFKSTPKAISTIIRHPGHDHNLRLNDLALLKVDFPFLYNPLFTLPDVINIFPSKGVTNAKLGKIQGNGKLLVAGWGRESADEDSPMSKSLKYTELIQKEDTNCTSGVPYFCVTAKDEGGVCDGDCGGPVVEYRNGEEVLVGVVSHPLTECGGGHVEKITRVAPNLKWIKEVLGFTAPGLKIEDGIDT